MGERIIRPGIRTSEAVAENIRKGGWMSGVIYFLLLTVVDDYGRYDARPAILKSELFPLLNDLVRETDVQRSLEIMSRAGLVRLYSHDGKPFLEIQKFRQRLRAQKSKWPAPDNFGQAQASAGQCHDNVMTMPTDTDTDTDTDTESTPLPPKKGGNAYEQDFHTLWKNYPKRDGKKLALRAWNASVKSVEDVVRVRNALGNYLRSVAGKDPQYIKNGSTWFRNWEDWVEPTDAMIGNQFNGKKLSAVEQKALNNRALVAQGLISEGETHD